MKTKIRPRWNTDVVNQKHEIFKDCGYHIINNFLDESISDFLYGYLMLAQKRLREVENNVIENESQMYGEFGNDTFSIYGDLAFDSILLGKKSELEGYTGVDLLPSFTEAILHKKNSVSSGHTDRENCQISLSVCLGFEGPKIWPLWIKEKNGKKIEVQLKKGDAIVYRETDVESWREPYAGFQQAQLLIHYSDKNTPNSKPYDNRVALGLGAFSKIENIMKKQFDKIKRNK